MNNICPFCKCKCNILWYRPTNNSGQTSEYHCEIFSKNYPNNINHYTISYYDNSITNFLKQIRLDDYLISLNHNMILSFLDINYTDSYFEESNITEEFFNSLTSIEAINNFLLMR